MILTSRNPRGNDGNAGRAIHEKRPVSEIAASEIVETIPSALIILDRHLNITSANRAFYQTFRTSPGETEGSQIYELGNRQWDIPALRTLLESVIPHRASVEGFEVEHDFPTIGRRTMLVNARKIFSPGAHDGSILLAIEDVSEERAARAESKNAWRLTQSIVDTIRDPLVVLEGDMTIVTASKAFLTMFGITEAATRGRRLADLGQHQWDVPALRHLMEKVLPENKPFESFEIEDDFPGPRPARLQPQCAQDLPARQPCPSHAAGVRGHHRPQAARARCARPRQRDLAPDQEQPADRGRPDRLRGQFHGRALRAGLPGHAGPHRRHRPALRPDLALEPRPGHRRGRLSAGDRQDHDGEPAGDTSGIVIEVAAEALDIDPERAVPFGLLVNELATNAIKHAFPGGTGKIVLSVERRVTRSSFASPTTASA